MIDQIIAEAKKKHHLSSASWKRVVDHAKDAESQVPLEELTEKELKVLDYILTERIKIMD